MTTPLDQHKVLEGAWDDNISWEFYLGEEWPDRAHCMVVYCLAILPSDSANGRQADKIVLTHIERGWEMLGGHLEPGETIEQGLIRECLEEGGFYPDSYTQFGYMKISAKKHVANDHHGGLYPLVTYVPHFIATTKRPLIKPSGEEVLGSSAFTLDEISQLNTNHEAIIRLGMVTYSSHESNLKHTR